MDALVTTKTQLRILLEMRPALDKHAGIPQQNRLLFRGLSLSPGVSVEGLLQSGTHALGSGVPTGARTFFGIMPKHRQIDRFARVVIMLEQKFWRSRLSAASAIVRRILGGFENLTLFDPTYFRDFIWRRMFARTLPPADFDLVTKVPFRVARTPWSAMHICALLTRCLGRPIFPRLGTNGFDVMITETPYPATVDKGTQLVVRYHDAIPLLLPHTISDRRLHQSFHYQALRRNVESGAWFVCVSEATRRDLLSIFPQVESRAITIHNMVSHDYFDEPSAETSIREIIRARLHSRLQRSASTPWLSDDAASNGGSVPYVLMVSTIEPRKNHTILLAAWERLRAELLPTLKLILVGELGWHHAPIIRKLRPWVQRGELCLLEDVPSGELRRLYKHARATVCPSFAEGFDLSGVEAMMSAGAVVASDIPAHREVYGPAAEYFNPYSVDDIVRAMLTVIDPARRRREELVATGAEIARRYTCETILPQWRSFLASRCAAVEASAFAG
jgi:glycosyltransferase involved in cell wall biosynthesis